MRYAAQVSLVVSLGGLVQFLPICLPCEPSVTALCAIVTAMHCVCRYEMLTQGSVTAYTCNDTKATKEPEMHGDLQEEPGLEPGAAATPKEACNETKAAEEPEMQGDLQEEPGLVPGAAAAPKQARVRGHGGKPFSEAEEDELRRGNPTTLTLILPLTRTRTRTRTRTLPLIVSLTLALTLSLALSLTLTLRRTPPRQRRVGHHPSNGQLRGASHERRPEGQMAQHGP